MPAIPESSCSVQTERRIDCPGVEILGTRLHNQPALRIISVLYKSITIRPRFCCEIATLGIVTAFLCHRILPISRYRVGSVAPRRQAVRFTHR